MARMQAFILFIILGSVTSGVVVQEDPVAVGHEDGEENKPLFQELPEEYVPQRRFKKNDIDRRMQSAEALLLPNDDDKDNDYDQYLEPPELEMNNHLRRKRQQVTSLTTPKYRYGPCYVSNGYKNNPSCPEPADICLDKDTKLEVACSLGPGASCAACPSPSNGASGTAPNPPAQPVPGAPPPPPPTPCPRGCVPGAGCPPPSGPPDGVCADPSRPKEDYDDSTSTIVPPVFLRPGSLSKGEPCNVYGDTLHAGVGQLGNKDICRWKTDRVQCISNEPRVSTTTQAGVPPNDGQIFAYERPAGTCKCMLALGGENAVALEDPDTGRHVCFIPANKGQHSSCEQPISSPYGGGKLESGENYCVPNSECRSGEGFTGRRCMCRKGKTLNLNEFTCSGAAMKLAINLPIALMLLMIFAQLL